MSLYSFSSQQIANRDKIKSDKTSCVSICRGQKQIFKTFVNYKADTISEIHFIEAVGVTVNPYFYKI